MRLRCYKCPICNAVKSKSGRYFTVDAKGAVTLLLHIRTYHKENPLDYCGKIEIVEVEEE